MDRDKLIFDIYNKADSIYFNEPALTNLLFKHMTLEQIQEVSKEIDTMVENFNKEV